MVVTVILGWCSGGGCDGDGEALSQIVKLSQHLVS